VPWVLVPWPVASELPAPPEDVVGGIEFDVPEAGVPIVAESVVPDAAVPLDVAPAAELPVASLLVLLVPVELQAARLMAIRPPIRRAWYFFIIHSCCKSDAIMAAHMPVRNRTSPYRHVGLDGRSLIFVAMGLMER
jgi:hypothetical protein